MIPFLKLLVVDFLIFLSLEHNFLADISLNSYHDDVVICIYNQNTG